MHQGEGTSDSPREGAFGGGLAHYYVFSQIHYGRKLAQGVGGHWSHTGDPIAFPEVYPMAEVPAGGYPETYEFDVTFTTLLRHLQAAWMQGDVKQLQAAIEDMRTLTKLAMPLIQTPLPGGGGNYGPGFQLIA
jgi:hypothetical protein